MADDVVAHELLVPSIPAPFQAALSAGPYNFEFTASNRLRLSVANSMPGVSVEVHYRVATRDAGIITTSEPFTPSSDRLVTTHEWTIGAGYVLNITALVAAGAPRKGQTYITLQALHGSGGSATVLGTMLAGYITANQPIAWPGSPIESSLEGTGFIRTVAGTQPASGFDISQTVPTGARWELLSLYAALSAGAGGFNRLPQLTAITAALAAKTFVPTTTPQPPALTYFWVWSSAGPLVSNSGDRILLPWPAGLGLLAGDVLLTQTAGLAVGDNWTTPSFTVREWLEV